MADDPEELEEQDDEDEDRARRRRRRRFGHTLTSPVEQLKRRLELNPRALLPWRVRIRRRRP